MSAPSLPPRPSSRLSVPLPRQVSLAPVQPPIPVLQRVRTKAVAILFVTSIVPAACIAWWMTGLYEAAVETTEKQIQSSVLAELSAGIIERVNNARADVEAVAASLAYAATDESAGDPLNAVKGVLATRRHIHAVRFLVPEAKVDTVISQAGSSAATVPSISESDRKLSDARGVAFLVSEGGVGLVVVRLPSLTDAAPRGYLAATVALEPVQNQVEQIALTRFDQGQVRLLVSDHERRAVARYGLSLERGDSVAALPIWAMLPEGTPWTSHVGVVSEFHDGDALQVGAVETMTELGWAVAIWRPRAEAYQSLTALGPRFMAAAAAVLVATLILGFFVARALTEPLASLARQVRLIGQRRWRDVKILKRGGGELTQLAAGVELMAEELEAGERQIEKEAQLRADLSRFMSQDLVTAIISGEHSLELGGKRALVTVLFADVVSFTPLAESEPAERIVGLLNELFSMLTEIVFRHHGTVDKFIGDCIMAVWGAPVARVDHATLALRAAEDMLRFLETANDNWRKSYGIELRLAIGVNSGEVVVGNIGSTKRMEYTVMGDAVNVAARLEGLAKPNQVLLTGTTRTLADAAIEVNPLGKQKLTGRAQETDVFELVIE